MGDPRGPKLGTDPVKATRSVLGYYKTVRGPDGMASSGGQELKLKGAAAVAAAKTILTTARTYTYPNTVFGDVRLVPGTIWSGNRVLLDAGPTLVHYMVGDNLYELRTSDFLRGEWLAAMAQGAKSAHWLVRIAKVSAAFTLGLLVPWYGMLLMSVATSLMVVENNQQDIDSVREHGQLFRENLARFAEKFPKTWVVVCRLYVHAVLENLHEGVHAEDIAFWLGRLLRGFRATREITLRALLGILVSTTAIVGFVHSPSFVSGALGPAAEDFARKLIELARGQDQSLSPEEARAVAMEIAANPQEAARLVENIARELQFIVEATKRISQYMEDHAV